MIFHNLRKHENSLDTGKKTLRRKHRCLYQGAEFTSSMEDVLEMMLFTWLHTQC